MNNEITVTHNDVPITYNENTNQWIFELRGRERQAESLSRARDIINTPVKTKQKKDFEPIPVYFKNYSSIDFVLAKITSFAETKYGHDNAWIVREDGKREKVNTEYVFSISPKNHQIIQKWREKRKEIRQANEEIEKLENLLEKVVAPKGVGDE